jgi:hypothetical protein
MSDACAEPAGGGPGLLSLATSLPGVEAALHAITTFDIGPVTEMLARAAYLPLLFQGPSREAGGLYELDAEPRRLGLAVVPDPARGGLAADNRVGRPAATLRCRWRLVPEDYVGHPGELPPMPTIALDTRVSQRIEMVDWELRFKDGVSGYRAYGTGRTLPGTAPGPAALITGAALVLEVLEGFGELAGLAGTVVASGGLRANAQMALAVITRFMDPAGGPLIQPPATRPAGGALAIAAAGGVGVTCMGFLGEIDAAHPVTLRLSLTEGVLGSNVFEQLRPAALGFDQGPGGALHAGATAGAIAGTVTARLSFDPLALCPMSPIQTRCGVFEFHDQAGASIGSVAANMTEGRAFRTGVPGKLLPVFRFAGFGPITGGTGEFAGASGVMTMNSAISVQPRTLANFYLLCLDDLTGRYRVAATRGAPGPPR